MMLHLKKYFTEGLIQFAILLSLCGVRVDVGLDTYLPASWHQMILGPTSTSTQTQSHNLRNRLEHGLPPKSLDPDEFFTVRRLLGWVRSLDRLQVKTPFPSEEQIYTKRSFTETFWQVPRAELETWLVQREREQASPLSGAPAAGGRERIEVLVEPGAGREEEEEEEEEEEQDGARTHHPVDRTHRHHRRDGGGRERSVDESDQRYLQTSSSLQECLRLLEETFPFAEDQQIRNVAARSGGPEQQPPDREPVLSSVIPTDNSRSDNAELRWQSLLALMEPQNRDPEMMMTSLDCWSDVQHQNSRSDQEVHQQHGWASSENHPPPLLPLAPSAELDDHSSTANTRDSYKNAAMTRGPPDHSGLLADDSSDRFYLEDFSIAQDDSGAFNLNALTGDAMESHTDRDPHSQAPSCPEDIASLHDNSQLCERTPSSYNPSLDVTDDTTQESPSSVFAIKQEEMFTEDDELPSPLGDILEDAALLDDIRLLDLALEEGFSDEMMARLEEENYLTQEGAQKETLHESEDGDSGLGLAVTSEGGQQEGEDEADSDSGLSLDFSHSASSPCASEVSSYSSSSSSSSTSSSSLESVVGSLFSDDEDECAEEALLSSDMEVDVKQEEEEEEMGAVGGEFFGGHSKLVCLNRGDHKMFGSFPWMEHVSHDHTYNEPRAPSPSTCKTIRRHTESSQRHDNAELYRRVASKHTAATRIWSRDERRARCMKIPFSNELIVNLPVEEFNDLLTGYQLDEEQIALIRDIRRRGKNKIAAQNCRKRKLGVLQGLEENVAGLRRHRSRLLREKQEALRCLQEMQRRLGILYQQVFSRMRDDEGRPLDPTQYLLHIGSDGSVTVASQRQGAGLSHARTGRKQRDKKK